MNLTDVNEQKKELASAKTWLVNFLNGFGINEEGNFTFALIRKPRKGQVAYYSSMSQFHSRTRIVLDIPTIIKSCQDEDGYCPEYIVRDEIKKSVAHEYGHVMAEAIRVSARRGTPMNTPRWEPIFDFAGDKFAEEEFAEDFARFAVEKNSIHEDFWDSFLRAYGNESRRLFYQDAA